MRIQTVRLCILPLIVFLASPFTVAATCVDKIVPYLFSRNYPNPESPFILIGLYGQGEFWSKTTELDMVARDMSTALHHKVITLSGFPEAGYVKNPKAEFEPREFETLMREGIDIALSRSPNQKVVIVRLDGINVKRIKDPPIHHPFVGLIGATNTEIKILLENPHYMAATRWVLDRKELSPEQVKELLGSDFPQAFHD